MSELINELDLNQFTGSEVFYQHPLGVVYTEGFKYLADKAGAYWLIELVATYQPKLKKSNFQLWTFERGENKSARVHMREDTEEPRLIDQYLEFSDFPLDYFEFYVVRDGYHPNGVVLLKTEY